MRAGTLASLCATCWSSSETGRLAGSLQCACSPAAPATRMALALAVSICAYLLLSANCTFVLW